MQITSAEWGNGLASGSSSVISTYSCFQHMQLLGQNSVMGTGYSYRLNIKYCYMHQYRY